MHLWVTMKYSSPSPEGPEFLTQVPIVHGVSEFVWWVGHSFETGLCSPEMGNSGGCRAVLSSSAFDQATTALH